MKRFFSLLFAAVLTGAASLSALGQSRDIIFTAGVRTPMNKGEESDATIGFQYGQFYSSGLGFRAGVQWSPSVADVDNVLSFPVAIAYRTRHRSGVQRLESAAYNAAEGVAYGLLRGEDALASNLISSFLAGLFSDVEYFAGLSPGYIGGKDSPVATASWGGNWEYYENTWTEKKFSPSLSADAGVCLNYGIGPVDIKLIPAFHYNLTGNLVRHSASGNTETGSETLSTTPLRWYFSFCCGIGIRF